MGIIRKWEKGCDGSAERAEAGEECAADDVGSRSGTMVRISKVATKKIAPYHGEHVGQRDVVQNDFQQAVENGIIGDVVESRPN